ncbi:MAG: RIP metalloprotease RseP [Xanthomonadales bacterium]|nr:RIP metalloprotease RseP [Xanthomonadales bacterium]
MSSIFFSLISFIVAIGVLVTVHEFGHFWVARRLGVKVLRFSIGFGKPLWKRTFGADNTELVVAAIPLGGYVKMLDEREGEVDAAEVERAFNRQSLRTRIAVVVAGPAFNFLFAIFAYWAMVVVGVPGLRPVVGDVTPASYAAQAGIVRGDEIVSIENKLTPTWEAVVLKLLDASLDDQSSVLLTVTGADGTDRQLAAGFEDSGELLQKGGVLENFGLSPWQPPAVIERLVACGAGDRGGLRSGDQVVMADGTAISYWSQWVDYVRERPEQVIRVQVLRDGRELTLELVPEKTTDNGQQIGRIGAYVRLPSEEQRATMRVVVRHGLLEALPAALEKTWSVTTLTLRTLWKMVTGVASVENLSGPISIAKYAGQSAAIGLATFLGFLGIVSVSLGVLNLLPVPVLDGGHLLFYLLEWIKGSPLSEVAQLTGQKIGIAMLLALMSLAFYNDIMRLLD